MISLRPSASAPSSYYAKKSTPDQVRLPLLRIVLLDLPLLFLFAAYISALLLELVHAEYLYPLMGLMEWTDERRDLEITASHHLCTEADITASVADELVITDDMSTDEALENMQVHGASIFPNILSNETADAVRAFIVEENTKQEGWFVINNKNRYSWGIQVDHHPSIAVALKEIAHHPVLRPFLERLVGRNPAVIEFTAITSSYGAATQNYHQDVIAEGSAAKYARSFLPSYSLFVPLQDTSSAMGATDLCPGTQLCGDDPVDLCLDHGISAAGSRDNWPKGWGALVNQQVTHRGTAHRDKFGLDRVVFILTFAPRPNYVLPGVVESRLLGQSGSYSLHWRHWGHTLDEFGAASKKMVEPFRTLKSLGIYKPASADWGWTVTTVALMRMANGENGYNRDTLEEFFEKGGFSLLPKWLQAPLDEDYDVEEGPPDGGWHDFLLATFQNVKEALRAANQGAAIVYLVGICLVSMWATVVHNSPMRGFSVLARNVSRVLLTHSLVLFLAWLYYTDLSNSYWASNIKSGHLFNPWSGAAFTETFDEVIANGLAFTLPNRFDVLLTPHYQSKYLASYSDILEYNQHGNRVWTVLVEAYSGGYEGLTPALQDQLCRFLVVETMKGKHRGRFLRLREPGRWSALTEEDAKAVCHKRLMRDVNPLIDALLGEVDYLETETNFGSWRDMAIHKSTIPGYLKTWSDRLLGLERSVQTRPSTGLSPSILTSMGPRKPLSIPDTTRARRAISQASRIPPPPSTMVPPFQSAWFATGDSVEAKYQGIHNEWYQGVVVDVSVDHDTYTVRYHDGEGDSDLSRRFVRPFWPYQVGERVDARIHGDTFHRGHIVAAHKDGTFAIRILGDNAVTEHVHSSDMRRYR